MSKSQYKVELHIHTAEASPCAVAPAAVVVARCAALGYSAVVITDHFCNDAHRHYMSLAQIAWSDRVGAFLSGYYAARAAAPPGMRVLLGAELRFDGKHPGDHNDYLIYGLSEEFLFQNENLHAMTLKEFRPLADKHGLLVVQAHPFRWNMRIARTELLDGMEVYNGNSHHDSHNEFAALWAARFGLLPLSGSDYHGDTDKEIAPGGIVLAGAAADERHLAELIRAGDYALLAP